MILSVGVGFLVHSREMSRRLTCQRNMQSLGAALRLYARESPGRAAGDLDGLLQRGLVEEEHLLCPTSGLTTSNYVLVVSDGVAPGPPTVIMYEPKSNHGGVGGNVLFADGHATFLRGAAYDAAVSSLQLKP